MAAWEGPSGGGGMGRLVLLGRKQTGRGDGPIQRRNNGFWNLKDTTHIIEKSSIWNPGTVQIHPPLSDYCRRVQVFGYV